jgi:hypothetical protein
MRELQLFKSFIMPNFDYFSKIFCYFSKSTSQNQRHLRNKLENESARNDKHNSEAKLVIFLLVSKIYKKLNYLLYEVTIFSATIP